VVWIGSDLPTFRHNLSVPSSRIKQSLLDSSKLGPLRCTETSQLPVYSHKDEDLMKAQCSFETSAATRRLITITGIPDSIRSFTKAGMQQIFCSESEQQDCLRICCDICKECRTDERDGTLQRVAAERGGSDMGRSERKGA